MKIAHICIFERYREDSGYQENLLSKCHVELGYDVYLIAQQRSLDEQRQYVLLDVGEYINKAGVKVSVLPKSHCSQHLTRFFGRCLGLYKKLDEISPNIIFVHNFTSRDIYHIVRYVKAHPDVELYVDSHSDYYNMPLQTLLQKYDAHRRKKYAQALLPVTKRFWGTTPWRVEYLQCVYNLPKEKLGLLIMGGDEKYIIGKNILKVKEDIRNHFNVPDDAFLVVTGGTIDKRKRQDILMDAVAQLSSQNIWLLVFGKPTKEMEPVIEKYKKTANIIFTGWIPAAEAYNMFLASDLAFFPGTHSVLWEQVVACGVPLVVQHWHGMEHVNYNGNAILVDNVNVDTIKHCIKDLKFTKVYYELKEKANIAAPQFFLSNLAKRAIGIQ